MRHLSVANNRVSTCIVRKPFSHRSDDLSYVASTTGPSESSYPSYFCSLERRIELILSGELEGSTQLLLVFDVTLFSTWGIIIEKHCF